MRNLAFNAHRGYFPLQSMSSLHAQDDTHETSFSKTKRRISSGVGTLVHHFKKHVGVGIICSVAYFDPGNWSVDLQAGSSFGYRPMLFVILLTGLGAIVFQASYIFSDHATLASKLGCVTGLDLASHCRLLLHDHPRHPRLVRWLVLYPLYVLAEVAIIATDLAELLGSAIGFCLLFPKLPLWGGVVLTAADVLIFLSISDPSRSQGRPVKMFEYVIIALVFAVFACFIALLIKAKPDWPQAFMGYLPSSGLFQSDPDAVYTAIGILGATIMPHGLFLGSSLATQDRISEAPQETLSPSYTSRATITSRIRCMVLNLFRIDRAERETSTKDYRSKYGDRENNSLSFIRQHLSHGITDIVSSLLAIAVPINSAILILAAAVFYKGPTEDNDVPAGLFDAHDLIKARLGGGPALIFALALVCAGQVSSITVTLAGQTVSEGFIEWRFSPFLRRLITRCISLIPSVVVAIAVGRNGINALLVASQVILSVVLPFVAFPLIYLTSTEVVMRVRVTPADVVGPDTSPLQEVTNFPVEGLQELQELQEDVRPESVDYSNGLLLTTLSYAIWAVVLVANAYAIVMLIMRVKS
ncbi:natural resistance-associated macrophage protein [Phlegmacium glaucopus]|nr:natural resistance-associated macrophage protein [Phlegmacium glaucopus]